MSDREVVQNLAQRKEERAHSITFGDYIEQYMRARETMGWILNKIAFGADANRTSVDGINSVDIPVLIIHGDADDTTSRSQRSGATGITRTSTMRMPTPTSARSRTSSPPSSTSTTPRSPMMCWPRSRPTTTSSAPTWPIPSSSTCSTASSAWLSAVSEDGLRAALDERIDETAGLGPCLVVSRALRRHEAAICVELDQLACGGA